LEDPHKVCMSQSEDTKPQQLLRCVIISTSGIACLPNCYKLVISNDSMKKLLFVLMLPLSVLAQEGKEFKIKGKLKTDKVINKVMISYRLADKSVSDSVLVKDGEFSYSGKIPEPTLVSLNFWSDAVLVQQEKFSLKNYNRFVFVEPGTIEIKAKDSIQNLKITGSTANNDYEALMALEKPYNEQLNVLYTSYNEAAKAKDTARIKILETQVDSVDALIKEQVVKGFVIKNPKSPIALWGAKQYAGYDIDPEKAGALYDLLPASVKLYPSAVAFKDRIEIARKTGLGQMAMEFTQNDTLGNPVSLSSFRGKYVLVDFWASWCGPCRRENPNVVKVFNEYKDKNFTILSVSLDRPNAKDKWLKAIHDDQLTWTHVSDLNYWDNAVAKQYGIQAIPQNILIDPKGKIIAKNLRGEDLERKLNEVYASR
jgi:peroxiredoxin